MYEKKKEIIEIIIRQDFLEKNNFCINITDSNNGKKFLHTKPIKSILRKEIQIQKNL